MPTAPNSPPSTTPPASDPDRTLPQARNLREDYYQRKCLFTSDAYCAPTVVEGCASHSLRRVRPVGGPLDTSRLAIKPSTSSRVRTTSPTNRPITCDRN